MTEKMPSSVIVGSRPSERTMCWYSPRVSPWRSRSAGSGVVMVMRGGTSRDGPRFREWGAGIRDSRSSRALECAFGGERRHHRVEKHEAVGAAERGLASALRMRHQPHDVPALVADAGDVVERSVRVGRVGGLAVPVGIAEDHAPIAL